MTTNPSIPEAAIDAGVRFLQADADPETDSYLFLVTGILQAAAPHLLKEALLETLGWLWDGYRSHNLLPGDGPCVCANCERVREALRTLEAQ